MHPPGDRLRGQRPPTQPPGHPEPRDVHPPDFDEHSANGHAWADFSVTPNGPAGFSAHHVPGAGGRKQDCRGETGVDCERGGRWTVGFRLREADVARVGSCLHKREILRYPRLPRCPIIFLFASDPRGRYRPALARTAYAPHEDREPSTRAATTAYSIVGRTP